jgi:hypothetical protein
MSFFYKESNNESTRNLYDKTVIYKDTLFDISQDYSCLVNFNFAEKLMYGKVNRNFVSMQARDSLTVFKRIANTDGASSNLRVMGFVHDAFFDLSRQFRKATQIRSIRLNDPYLTNLKAFDAYQTHDTAYSQYVAQLIEGMATFRDQRSFEIYNFETFINFVESFCNNSLSHYPLTKTGFMKSKFNPMLTNGITIEIADLSYENDQQKIDAFVNSPNFEYYLNACNSFGFMVDMLAPWRIVADLDSEAMQAYAATYGYDSTDEIITFAYTRTEYNYYQTFKQQLLALYNSLSYSTMSYDECSGGAKITNPKNYTIDQINNLYNESYFIKLYCKLRFLEEETKHLQATQDQIITDVVNLSSAKDIREALRQFEIFISQPFDYRGSLSYIVREQETREGT